MDIDAGDALVGKIAPLPAMTDRPRVMDGLGGFGALFDLKKEGVTDPELVSSTDCVLTKVKTRRPRGPALPVDRLRMTCGPDQPILVVSSSYTLNSDLLVQAERQFYGRANTRLTVVPTAEVDTRDSYPVSRLIAAQCAVVAIPLQLHLAADEQDLLSVSHAMFRDRVGVAWDFERDPGTLELRWGVQVEVFRRVRPTPPEHGLETLRLFESAIPEPPPTQPRWVMVARELPRLGDCTGRLLDSYRAPPDASRRRRSDGWVRIAQWLVQGRLWHGLQ